MKMKITILEDSVIESERLKNGIRKYGQQYDWDIEIDEYESGEEYFSKNSEGTTIQASAFFLDIQMGQMNGIEVAKRLRESGYQGIIVFLTAFREYVFRGYEVRALNYLLKPVKENTLFLCLDEIAKELSNNTYIYRNKQEIVSIPYADILTFSSRLHYVDILTVDGKCYEQMSTLNKIIVHLPSEFIRTHRSYIVNMAHIYRITSGTIELSNHLTTQIARSYTNADELKSIQVGGIDFITKPYDTLILLEKIKRALQLSNPSNFRELVKKDCTLDLHLSILKYQEQSIELTRNEFRILYYFFMNEDKVISKEELLEKLWNDKYYIDENVLLVNMTRLKKKMKEIGIVHLLENIRGKGWKL